MIDNFKEIYGCVLTGKERLDSKEVQVCCPFHGDKNPSMSINTQTGTYYCFGCGARGSAIGFYMRYNRLTYPEAMTKLGKGFEPKPYKQVILHKQDIPKPRVDYTEEMIKAIEYVFNHYEFFCKKLYGFRGITMNTAICCFVGYNPSKGWMFPVFEYPKGNIVGYEVRQKEFKKFKNDNKCYKAKDTPSCLSIVNVGWLGKKAIVCEGFIDAYIMFQYLYEKSETGIVSETILTPSNGVKSLVKIMQDNKLWNDFDEVIFVLDNDDAGNEVKAKLVNLEHEGKFKFFSKLEDGEDFDDYYRRINK